MQHGDRVGLYLDKSLESLVGIYAILKPGGAYVPLDPPAPAARLATIAANADLRCLITGVEKAELWSELLAEGAPVADARRAERLRRRRGRAGRGAAADGIRGRRAARHAARGRPRSASDLAYILYTSGSTGEPKGVMLSHRNALAFVDWAADEFEVTAEDRLSSHAPLHFDLSVFDLFAAARAGAAVVLVPGSSSLFPSSSGQWISDDGHHGLVLGALDPDAARPARQAGGDPVAGPADDALRGRGLPDQVPARADAAAPARPLREPVRADRDERVHLVRGPALGGRPARLDPDRQGRCATSRSSPSPRTGRVARDRRGRRAVRARADRDAGLLGRPRADEARRSSPTGETARARIRPTRPATSPTSTRTATGSSSAAATRRSRAAATGSSSATSRRR